MKIKVRVCTSASYEKIVPFAGGLKVYTCAAPEKGKANKKVLALLAKYLKVKKASLKIIKGELCRDKVIEVEEN